MKTSLLAAAVLSSLMVGGVAQADQAVQMPPLAPVQIISGASIQPVAVKAPVKSAKAKAAKPAAKAAANQAATNKDAAALASERAAEAEFNKKKAAPVVAKPSAVKPAVETAAAKAAAAKAFNAKAAKAAAEASKVPVPAQPAATVAVKVKAAKAVAPRARTSKAARRLIYAKAMRAQAAALVSASAPGAKVDAAALLKAHCATLGKGALACLKLQLKIVENKVDAQQTKLLQCQEQRKSENLSQAQEIQSYVSNSVSRIGFSETQGFNKSMASIARANTIAIAEAELRATLKQMDDLADLSSLICNREAFAFGFEKAQEASAQ